jgi:hypothetical protein
MLILSGAYLTGRDDIPLIAVVLRVEQARNSFPHTTDALTSQQIIPLATSQLAELQIAIELQA